VNGVRGFHSERDDGNYNGLGDVFNDWKEGIMETTQGMFKARNPRAFGYLAITWLFTLVNVLHNIPLFYKLFWVRKESPHLFTFIFLSPLPDLRQC
jgi:hypothetical protein